MDLSKIFIKEKELSSIQLEKQDITYQVWEMGSILAGITELILKMFFESEDGSETEDISKSAGEIERMLKNFHYICEKLCDKSAGVIGGIADIEKDLKNFIDKEPKDSSVEGSIAIQKEIDKWRIRISYELRAKSIHLCNVFECSYGLKLLRAKLLYDIESETTLSIIEMNVENIEKLEKGDKILTSPNLELTNVNLGIIRSWLEGLRKHYKKRGGLSIKDPESSRVFVNSNFSKWENFLLDIKNPSDYLTRRRKLFNRIVPFFICYYLAAIPVSIAITGGLFGELSNSSSMKQYITIMAGFIPMILAGLRYVYCWLKDVLTISSFKFSINGKHV